MISRLISLTLIAVTSVAVTFGCSGSLAEEENSENGRLFAASCQSCHTLPSPTMKSDAEWPTLVNRYGERAKLSQEEIDRITVYLVANN
jgi:cytochrome c2